VRIAIHVSGELGVRSSRVLLAESGVHVGLFDEDSTAKSVQRVEQLADWDVLVVDEISVGARVHMDRAIDLGLAVVLARETSVVDDSATLVVGVLDGARLAMALAASRIGGSELMEAELAWTVEGHPLRSGVGVTFPDPVGALWADTAGVPAADSPTKGFAAPFAGKWRAITARLTMGTDDGLSQEIYGISDDRGFLDGAVLAAAAMAAAEGAYPVGVSGPGDPEGVFLRNAERAGLHIAAFTATPCRRRAP